MPIGPGQELLHYRLTQKIGEGGMGVVWRAVDTTLDREVAIKILPEALAGEAERLARFEREAKLLATLNHPNIAAIYGFHATEGLSFLVMELVEGENLHERLSRGPLPVDEALEAAKQVAEALEAAHENGVVHRDLKPANIHCAPDGTVKVLDFGLAKAFDPGSTSRSSDPAFSPTLTSAGSVAGMILGTAAYMSPEQARGRSVDKRSDIWAFGCVLFETLTSKRLYQGETVSDTIALILQTQPDWSSLPDNTPTRVRHLLERSLTKDPRQRLRDIGDARFEIDRALAERQWTDAPTAPVATVSETTIHPRRNWGPMAAVFVIGGLMGASLWGVLSPGGTTASPPVRVSILSPPDVVAVGPALTPDGKTVLFGGVKEDLDVTEPESSRIFVRKLSDPEAVPIPETEDASLTTVSPDGRWLAYRGPAKPNSTERRLFKIPLDGSAPPLTLTDWNDDWSDSMVWLPDDDILVTARSPIALVRIAADGSGVSSTVGTEFPEGVTEILARDVLPDGRHVLVDSYTWDELGYHDRTFAVNVESGEHTKILNEGTNPRWSSTGHLVFTRRATLLALSFDAKALEPRGGPITIADGLRTGLADASAFFDLTPEGTLVYQTGGRVGSRRRVVFLEEDGSVRPWSDDRLAFQEWLRVSPDGNHMATTVMKEDDLLFSVWVSDLERPRLRLWKAEPRLDCNQAVWHPDNRRIVYNCVGDTGDRGVYIAPFDDSEPPRLLWRGEREGAFSTMQSVHPSGSHCLVNVTTAGGSAVLRIPVEETAGELTSILPQLKTATATGFSPDGKWIAYSSNDAGRSELFVASYAENGTVGRPTLVDAVPQLRTLWLETDRPDVFELVYLAAPHRSAKVTVRTTPRLSISDPEPYQDFSNLRPRILTADVLPDGRFLGIQQDSEESGTRQVHLVFNFDQELARLAP
ncbi:MAG: protein kinase [Acidobacteriota bacterium]|nr:protein kinase [Acidobacteriota bacterium]